MPSVRKTPSLSPEARLRVLHNERARREAEVARIEKEFARRYPGLDYFEVKAWKTVIDQERGKLEKVLRAIERMKPRSPAPDKQTTFGWE